MRKRSRLDLLPPLPRRHVPEPDQLLTLEEAADLTGLTLSTWRSWIAGRKIPYVKLGRAVRIKASELEKLITHGERLAVNAGGYRPPRKAT